MHYKNGREAREGDPIIFKDYNGKVKSGSLHSTTVGTDTCNGQAAYAIMGGMSNACITLKECYHAEDAFLAVEDANSCKSSG